MGFPEQEYWNKLPFPPAGGLLDPRIKLMSFVSPALADRFFTTCTARGITSFLQSLRSSPERPGEALSSLGSAGPRFRAALPPARHYLSSPVPFRALPRHHTSPGQDAGPHQSRPTAGGELQGSRARLKPQGPASEGPGRPQVENALPSEDQTAEFEMMFPHKRF